MGYVTSVELFMDLMEFMKCGDINDQTPTPVPRRGLPPSQNKLNIMNNIWSNTGRHFVNQSKDRLIATIYVWLNKSWWLLKIWFVQHYFK